MCIYIYIYTNTHCSFRPFRIPFGPPQGSKLQRRRARKYAEGRRLPSAYIHVCVYICICVYMYIYIYIYIHTYTHIHTYIHAYMHTCIHAYMHTCIHAYIHTYIHVSAPERVTWFGKGQVRDSDTVQ